MLTAAKRGHVQGTFSYTTEAEAWASLGITDPPFELDTFLRVTGHLKQTRKRRRGRITDVQITAWKDWNNTANSEVTRERNARSKRMNTDETQTESEDLRSTESDSESDSEKAAAEGFAEFHLTRAKAEAQRRKFEGIPVKTVGGLGHHIAENDREFLSESERLWAHLDCEVCDGKGFTETYASGRGMVKVECTREV